MVEHRSEKSIFLEAIEKTASERAGFLDRACGDNPPLRAEVEALLRAHEKPQLLLDVPEPAVQTIDRPQFAEQPGTVIGPYKLLQQIGEGGMGTVYMAEQTNPVQRKVAVKVIKAGMDSRQVIARFEAERQALAMMDHVNIARVLDAGTTESGLPYFVMELVHGIPITKYCDDNHLTPRERLELFVPVCQAIQHAHQKGIIHRDIKPSNVMVTLYDGKPVPKVIDFGVAKATEQKLTERTLFTQYGAMVGTLEYMSPEQAEMSALGVDTRSDIYSLGVLLYELLTGSTPLTHKRMKEAAYGEILRMIKEDEPPKPSTRLTDSGEALASISANRHMEPAKLTKLVRGELDWIVMKTLEKDRNRRYETANAFAADVQRYLADETVQACPPSAWYRFRKFARRNKVALLTASATAMVILLALIGLAVSNVRITQEKNEKAEALQQAKINEEAANTQKSLAEENAKTAAEQRGIAVANEKTAKANELLAARRLYAAQMNLAMQAWETGQSARVLQLLEGQRPKPDQEDMRTFEWYYLWQLSHRGHQRTLQAHTDGTSHITQLAFSPDGTTLASACMDGRVRLWDPATGQERASLDVGSGVLSVAFAADGKTLATGDAGQQAKLWDLVTGQQLATLSGHSNWVRSVAFSPDGKTLATGSSDTTVMIWDAGSRRLRATLKGHIAQVCGVTFSPNGRTLASVSWDGTARLWEENDDSWRERICIKAHHSHVWAVAFAPDGNTLATGSGTDGTTKIWDVATGQERTRWPGIYTGGFSPDGKLIVTSSQRTVTVWDVTTKQERFHYDHLALVKSSVFSPDGKTLASASSDGIVNLWDVTPASGTSHLQHPGSVGSVVFSPDSKTLFSGGVFPAQRWDVATAQGSTLPGHTGHVGYLAMSADGKTLASPGPNKTVKLWDSATGQEKGILAGQEAASALIFSPDGKTVVTWRWANDKTLRLLDVVTRQQKAVFTIDGHQIHNAAFSPDGKLLAAATMHNFVYIWEVRTGQRRHVLRQEPPSFVLVQSVVFAPDSKTLAAGSETGTVRVWDVETGQIRASFKGHADAVVSLTFSPDGKTLATGSRDATVRLWDVVTGQERLTLKGQEGSIRSLAFSPDGNTLASGSSGGTVRLWRAAAGAEARTRKTWPDRDDPDDPQALNEAADRSWHAGRRDVAEKLFRQALASLEKRAAAPSADSNCRRELPFTWFCIGLVVFKGARSEEAARSCQHARELQASLPQKDQHWLAQRYAELGNRLLGLGHAEEGAAAYTQAVELNPEEARYWNLLGVANSRLDQKQEALASFTKAIELKPAEPVQWSNRGSVSARLGQHDKALADYAKAIELKPENGSFWSSRGGSNAELGHWNEAAADFAKAAELKTDDPLHRYRQALARLQLKDIAGYRRLCADILGQSDPAAKTDSAQWAVWTCVLAADAVADWKVPLQLAEKAVADNPKNYRSLNHHGAVLYRASQYKEALKRLTEAEAAYQPDDKKLHAIAYNWLFLAMAHQRLGQVEEAKKWHDKAVQGIDQETQKPKEPVAANPLPWNRRLTLQLLRCEAEKLLKQK